jgi:hypothetical protein
VIINNVIFQFRLLKKLITNTLGYFRIILLPPRPKNEVPTQAKETPSEYKAPFIVDCLSACLLGLGNETF